MKKTLFMLSILLLNYSFIYSSEVNIIKEERSDRNFHTIQSNGNIRIIYTISNNYSVEVEADPEDVSYIKTSSKNNKLIINDTRIKKNNNKATVYISSPDLRSISISGAVIFEASEIICPDKLNIEISGAGKLEINNLTALNTNIQASGAANLKIKEAVVPHVQMGFSGAAKGEIAFRSSEIAANTSGASHITMKGAAGKIKIRASGASKTDIKNMKYETKDISSSGAAHIHS